MLFFLLNIVSQDTVDVCVLCHIFTLTMKYLTSGGFQFRRGLRPTVLAKSLIVRPLFQRGAFENPQFPFNSLPDLVLVRYNPVRKEPSSRSPDPSRDINSGRSPSPQTHGDLSFPSFKEFSCYSYDLHYQSKDTSCVFPCLPNSALASSSKYGLHPPSKFPVILIDAQVVVIIFDEIEAGTSEG